MPRRDVIGIAAISFSAAFLVAIQSLPAIGITAPFDWLANINRWLSLAHSHLYRH